MTDQETFDKVARHLLTQKERSMCLNNTNCAYRGVDGLKCAVGALIPDELYTPDLEGQNCDDPEVAMVLEGLGYRNTYLCRRLQMVHDTIEPARDGHCLGWKHWLAEVAKDFGLSSAVLQEFDSP
jgi:hypothetical protein